MPACWASNPGPCAFKIGNLPAELCQQPRENLENTFVCVYMGVCECGGIPQTLITFHFPSLSSSSFSLPPSLPSSFFFHSVDWTHYTELNLQHLSPGFWQCLSLVWNLASRRDWLPVDSSDPPVSASPALGLKAEATTLGTFMWFWELNSHSHACKAITLPTGLSLQPPANNLFTYFVSYPRGSCIHSMRQFPVGMPRSLGGWAMVDWGNQLVMFSFQLSNHDNDTQGSLSRDLSCPHGLWFSCLPGRGAHLMITLDGGDIRLKKNAWLLGQAVFFKCTVACKSQKGSAKNLFSNCICGYLNPYLSDSQSCFFP